MAMLDKEQARARLEALSKLEEHLSFRISRLSKLLDNHSAKVLAGTDAKVNLTSYRILLVLSIFNETSASDLSRLMVIDRAQISRSVAQMIDGGLLTERPDPQSKRRKLLRLTSEGRSELAKAKPTFDRRQQTFEDVLSADELAGLTVAVDSLSRFIAEEIDQPEALPSSRHTS